MQETDVEIRQKVVQLTKKKTSWKFEQKMSYILPFLEKRKQVLLSTLQILYFCIFKKLKSMITIKGRKEI